MGLMASRAEGVHYPATKVRNDHMSKLYFVFIGLLFALGIGFVVYFGIQPRPVAKIDLSLFPVPGDMGVALTRSLQQEIKGTRLLLLGITPGDEKNGAALWRGFLKSLTDGGLPVNRTLVDVAFPDLDLGVKTEMVDLRNQLPAIGEALHTALKNEPGWIVIVAPTFYTSQHLTISPAARLVSEFKLQPISISSAPLPRTRDDEKTYPIPCVTNDEATGTGPLGCLFLQRARTLYRKLKDSDKYQGVADQIGLKDYVVLMLEPSTSATKAGASQPAEPPSAR